MGARYISPKRPDQFVIDGKVVSSLRPGRNGEYEKRCRKCKQWRPLPEFKVLSSHGPDCRQCRAKHPKRCGQCGRESAFDNHIKLGWCAVCRRDRSAVASNVALQAFADRTVYNRARALMEQMETVGEWTRFVMSVGRGRQYVMLTRYTGGGHYLRIYEQVYVWQKAFGVLPPGYLVHHIDENPLNNDLDNLQAKWCGDHKKVHPETALARAKRTTTARTIGAAARRDTVVALMEEIGLGYSPDMAAERIGISHQRAYQILYSAKLRAVPTCYALVPIDGEPDLTRKPLEAAV